MGANQLRFFSGLRHCRTPRNSSEAPTKHEDVQVACRAPSVSRHTHVLQHNHRNKHHCAQHPIVGRRERHAQAERGAVLNADDRHDGLARVLELEAP